MRKSKKSHDAGSQVFAAFHVGVKHFLTVTVLGLRLYFVGVVNLHSRSVCLGEGVTILRVELHAKNTAILAHECLIFAAVAHRQLGILARDCCYEILMVLR